MATLDAHRRLIGTLFPSFSERQVRRRVRRDDIDGAYATADSYGVADGTVDDLVHQRLRQRMGYSTLDSPEFAQEAGYDRETVRSTAIEVAETLLEGDADHHARSTAADLLTTYSIDPDTVDGGTDLPMWAADPLEAELAEAVLYADDADAFYDHADDRPELAFADPDETIAVLDERIEERYAVELQTEIGSWDGSGPSMDPYERVGADWFIERPEEIIDGLWGGEANG